MMWPGAEALGLLADGSRRPGHAPTGNIGQAVDLRPGEVVTLIQLNNADVVAQQMTVCLMGPEPSGVGPALASRVVADVAWGVGHFQARAEVDFVRGTQFSLAASGLTVSARNEVTDPNGSPVRVGAFVGYSAARSGTPQRSFYLDLPGQGRAVGRLIPPFAFRFDLLRAGPAAAYRIVFRDAAGMSLAEFEVDSSQSLASVPVLPNGATRVELSSNIPLTLVLVFGLAL